jgi:hypothetical protein
MALLLLLVALIFLSTASGGDRTLAAEGDYIQESAGNRAPAPWKLWHLGNGEYEVVETLRGPGRIMQVFSFDRHFLPSGFSLTIDTTDKGPRAKLPPFAVYPTIISCRYDDQAVSCKTDINGKKAVTTIPVNKPYVVAPAEFYALDFVWLTTGIVRLFENSSSPSKAVTVIVLTNDKIHGDTPVELAYKGEITAQVMGKAQRVAEYEAQIGGDDQWWGPGPVVLQVNPQGFVLSVRGKLDPAFAFTIGNYKEYESWQPRLNADNAH